MSRTYSLARVLARASTKRRTRRVSFTAWCAGPAHGLVKSQLGKTRDCRPYPVPVPGSLEWAHDVLDLFTPSTTEHKRIAAEIIKSALPVCRSADLAHVVLPVDDPIGDVDPSTEEGQRLTRRRITVILTLDGRKGVPDTVVCAPKGSFVIPSPGSVEWAHDVADCFIDARSNDRKWAESVLSNKQVRL